MDPKVIWRSAIDADQIAVRMDLAEFTATVFRDVGAELHVLGRVVGVDPQNMTSPFESGDDESVAISMLLRIGSQLVSGSADLIADGRHYAGSALIRQLVEVEYLAWAFETNNDVSDNWLRSTRDERRKLFTPEKLRKAAGDHFRSLDYGYHCELGGHPVPGSWILLYGDIAVAQNMLSDCLGHSGRIWNHILGWSKNHSHGDPVLRRSREMSERYSRWMDLDLLTKLPPPPEFPDNW